MQEAKSRDGGRYFISCNELWFSLIVALMAVAAIIGTSMHAEAGYLSICVVAWLSFFALAVVRDYSGGQYVYWMSQICMAAFTEVCCFGGELGDLGRAILLSIIPVFGAYAMWEFYKKLRHGNVLTSCTNLLKS